MSDFIGNDTLTFLNDFVDLDVFDKNLVAVQITGTWTATITWTGSIDGTNYFAIFPTTTSSASTGANQNYLSFNAAGLSHIRFTATAFTSGTVNLNWVCDLRALVGNVPTTSFGTGLIAGTSATSLGKAEDAVAGNADTGVAVWGVRNEARTTLTSNDGDYGGMAIGAGGETLAASVGLANPLTAGLSVTSFLSAGTINATVLKATPGNVYAIHIVNTTAALKYVKFYNKATTPAPATDNALLQLRLGVPPTSSITLAYDIGVPFTTGIGLATVTGTSDTDATAVAAADLMVNVTWR